MQCRKCFKELTGAQKNYCSKSCANSANASRTRLANHVQQNGVWNKGVKGCLAGGKSPHWKGGEVTIVCIHCSTYFHVRPYRLKTAKYCSPLCRIRHNDKGLTPANERVRKSAAYRAWRTLVFERDNYTCQNCFQRGGYLHADHIKPFAFFPELRLNVSNGRTLCIPCHKKTPTYGVGAWRNRNCAHQ
jgi:hypothetical protein